MTWSDELVPPAFTVRNFARMLRWNLVEYKRTGLRGPDLLVFLGLRSLQWVSYYAGWSYGRRKGPRMGSRVA
jgi:hypothetical protein